MRRSFHVNNALLKKSSELDLFNRVNEHAQGSAVNCVLFDYTVPRDRGCELC